MNARMDIAHEIVVAATAAELALIEVVEKFGFHIAHLAAQTFAEHHHDEQKYRDTEREANGYGEKVDQQVHYESESYEQTENGHDHQRRIKARIGCHQTVAFCAFRCRIGERQQKRGHHRKG